MVAEYDVRHVASVAGGVRLVRQGVRERLVVCPRLDYQECPCRPIRRVLHRVRRARQVVVFDPLVAPVVDLVTLVGLRRGHREQQQQRQADVPRETAVVRDPPELHEIHPGIAPPGWEPSKTSWPCDTVRLDTHQT